MAVSSSSGTASHPSSRTPGVGLSGLVPRPESPGLGGLPFVSSDYRDFRAHGPRIGIDDLSAPSGRFITRVSAAVTTADRRPGRGEFIQPPTPRSLRCKPCLLRATRARQKNPLPRRLSPTILLPSRTLHRESTPPRSLIRPGPPLRRLAPRTSDCLAAFGPHLHSDAPTNSRCHCR